MAINIYREVREFTENLDYHTDPRGSLEKIIEYARKHFIVDKLFAVTKTYELVLRCEERAKDKGWVYACNTALDELKIDWEVIGARNIPKEGSSIFPANHPYGMADSLVLIAGLGGILEKGKKPFKIVGMHKLKVINGIEDVVLFVDTPPSIIKEYNIRETPVKPNTAAVREAINYLKNEGNLAIYPAGEVSGPHLLEYPWRENLGKFVRFCDNVVPMQFVGSDHEWLYNQIAKNKKTKQFRSLFSFREAWRKKGKKITLVIGESIPRKTLDSLGDNGRITSYIKEKCEELRYRVKAA